MGFSRQIWLQDALSDDFCDITPVLSALYTEFYQWRDVLADTLWETGNMPEKNFVHVGPTSNNVAFQLKRVVELRKLLRRKPNYCRWVLARKHETILSFDRTNPGTTFKLECKRSTAWHEIYSTSLYIERSSRSLPWVLGQGFSWTQIIPLIPNLSTGVVIIELWFPAFGLLWSLSFSENVEYLLKYSVK